MSKYKWNDKIQMFEKPKKREIIKNKDAGPDKCFRCGKAIRNKRQAKYHKNLFYEIKVFCSQDHKLAWIFSKNK